MTNPPFGSVVKASESPYYKDYELFETNLGIAETKERIESDDDKKKWKTSQSTEILFLERCYRYLREGGFLAIVLPDGVLTNSSSQYVRDWLFEKYRIVAVVSLPQHTFSHVNAGVKSSVLFLRKHELSITRSLEKMLARIKEAVNDDKSILKSEKANAILERYKKEAFSILPDYEVLMLEVENVGYDATGRKKDGSELPIVSEKIRNFISKQGW